MTEKDFKKLNRYQLLELLLAQTERADKLQAELEAAQVKLAERELKMASLGSIAEASLELGGVFGAAQTAADMYILAAQKKAEEIEADAREKAAQILSQGKCSKGEE